MSHEIFVSWTARFKSLIIGYLRTVMMVSEAPASPPANNFVAIAGFSFDVMFYLKLLLMSWDVSQRKNFEF